MKLKIFCAVFLIALAVSSRAGAESLAVLDVYVEPRIPLDYLEGMVEPWGDDIFAAESRGLSRTVSRLVHGLVKQHSDYAVKKLVNPVALSIDPQQVFQYFIESENPEDFYDRAVLAELSGELGAQLVLVGIFREIEIKKLPGGADWVRLKVSFSLYDTASGQFSFTQTYEKSTDSVTGYVDPDIIPAIQGRVPTDIRKFVSSEIGRVFMSIAEVFISDLTSTDISSYLSDSYVVKGDAGYVDGTAGFEAGAGGGGVPSDRMKECSDKGQAILATKPEPGAGIRLFACFDGEYDLEVPDQVTGDITGAGAIIAGMSAGDFDGDGIDELVVSSHTSGENVRIFKMKERAIDTENVLVRASGLIPGYDSGVWATAGDFDGDGTAELAVSSVGKQDSVVIYDFSEGDLVTGRPIITFKENFEAPAHGVITAAGDFNGDGIDELIIGSLDAGEKVKVFMVPSGMRPRPSLIGDFSDFFGGESRSVNVAAGDFDGDGKDDLVMATLDHGVKVKVLRYGEGGFDVSKPMGNIRTDANGPDNGARVAVADFDGDGRDDLAVSIIGNPEPEIWIFKYANGAFDLQNPYIGSTALYPRSAGSSLMVVGGKFE